MIAALLLGACGSDGGGEEQVPRSAEEAQGSNPFADRDSFADPGSKTAQAATAAEVDGDTDRAEVFSRLAEVPQGVWLTPEEHPVGEVGSFVTSVVEAADEAGQVPTLVVYGVPGRDCTGGYSAGGLPADQYGPWVREIAEAASQGDRVAAVVEPDALASLLECGDREQRVALISDAAQQLAEAGVTTYLDGGHSRWVEPNELAPLLEDAGIAEVRGFATNVSNFQADEDERAYAEELSSILGGVSYVIDSGRNGFGSSRDWCNPPGRAFGTEPGTDPIGERQDAFVWVKPPGESDGECNGGPAAGQFWPERAMELASASGW